jgi:S1-C subfamily serine protease
LRVALGFLIAAALLFAERCFAQPADTTDDSLRIYAVHVSGGLYGVYLGQGLIITAAHVVGSANPPVRIAGLNLSAKVVKSSPFEQLDLALLSVDEEKLPVSLRLRRMPLCQRPLFAGEPVIVAIPERTARSQVVSPLSLPSDIRNRFSTAIKDVATTGNSGSGVFDANRKCLLGIMSRKIFSRPVGGGADKDLAKYFVAAPIIRAFIPSEYGF